MAKRKVSKTDDLAVDFEEVQAGSYTEGQTVPMWQNANVWFYAILGAGLIFGLWYAYKEFYAKPQALKAEAASWQAQQMFERDSFQLALENPGGGFDGFLSIISNYGGTPAGNTAKLYAGLSYLQLGQFDDAIKHLESYSPSSDIFATTKFIALGDAFSEKEDMAKAISMYEKAANTGKNELMNVYALKKLGLLNQAQGNVDAAKKAFTRIKYEFPLAPEAREVEKYIGQLGGE